MLDDPRLGLSGEATELGVLDFTSLLPKFADTWRSNQLLNKGIQLPTGQRDVATAWNQKWQRLLIVATLMIAPLGQPCCGGIQRLPPVWLTGAIFWGKGPPEESVSDPRGTASHT